ncbi:MAG TPA: crotonyl-CoA carboxylase/reductase [Kofleriaceae bacterium]|jgi:crotonyl-CoA carboxylase/reductase|nr:crotonyl-CoA carboxylase/reductase [Kofleriaceae bacterium]
MASSTSQHGASAHSSHEPLALGDVPELGAVPAKMLAQVIRADRFGEPRDAFKQEALAVPELGPRDVLVYVMAAGVNYNNVWAAMGIPIDVIKTRQKKGEPEDFHVGGSDASGVVWATGKAVTNVNVGDAVVVHCGMWEPDDPHVLAGKDPMFAPTQRIWGYESNWGSFAQYTKVQDHQCVPKPAHLTWEQAAAYMLVAATAYRMLHGWSPNVVAPGDPVLIWGGAGGLGSMAIQIARAAGARPVAVVSGDSKNEFCMNLGAVGVIDRRKFDHWGKLPRWSDELEYGVWLKGARAFGSAFWGALGEKKNPTIVFEHPGETTLPTSCFMAETGGMVVICAGTTGYNATLDLRYHWMRQKRLQGSHFANDDQARGVNQLVIDGKVDPCLSRTFAWGETAACHQLMRDNQHPSGNMAILVNAPKPGLRTLAEVRDAGGA